MSICSFQGQYRWLSNFYGAETMEDVERRSVKVGFMPGVDAQSFPSVENAYQAAKCANEADRAQFLHITAGQAKRLGRKVKVRDDWDDVKVDIMRELVRQKFENSYDLRQKLYATGDRLLIEGNTWGDRFWGICEGAGENMLGKILMEVRSELEFTEEDRRKLSGRADSDMPWFDDVLQELKVGRVACFTGHRNASFPFQYNESGDLYNKVIASLDKAIDLAYKNGFRTFISGMAMGVDMWAVERLLVYKETHPDIVIVGAIPCYKQEVKWVRSTKQRYVSLIARLDGYGYVSRKTFAEDRACMHNRNHAMVDASELVIAIYDGRGHRPRGNGFVTHTKGGTAECFTYAYNKGTTILHYNWVSNSMKLYNKKER